MKKLIIIVAVIVIGFFILSRSCSPMYENDDVIASFKGEEIYVKDLKLLYDVGAPAIPEVARNFVFLEVVMYEAQELGMEVDPEEVDTEVEKFRQELETDQGRRIAAYLEDMAEEDFNMDMDEYIDTIVREELEKNLYVSKMREEVIYSEVPDDLNELERRDWIDGRFDEWYFETLARYDDEIEYYFDVDEIEWE